MGAKLGQTVGGGRARGGGDDLVENHEINVTPFIDVMLVLLIIFMVAAPLSTVDLPIDLQTSTAQPQKKPDKPTYVEVGFERGDAVSVDGERLSPAAVLRRLNDLAAQRGQSLAQLGCRHRPLQQGLEHGQTLFVAQRSQHAGHLLLVKLE